MTDEERIARLENSFVLLTELALSADEWRDIHRDWISQLAEAQARLAESQANLDVKMAALVDAQIRTESAQADLEVKWAALVDAQMRTEQAQARTEEAFVRLAEAQAHTDRRLDALIGVVSQGRDKSENR